MRSHLPRVLALVQWVQCMCSNPTGQAGLSCPTATWATKYQSMYLDVGDWSWDCKIQVDLWQQFTKKGWLQSISISSSSYYDHIEQFCLPTFLGTRSGMTSDRPCPAMPRLPVPVFGIAANGLPCARGIPWRFFSMAKDQKNLQTFEELLRLNCWTKEFCWDSTQHKQYQIMKLLQKGIYAVAFLMLTTLTTQESEQ